MGCLNKYYLGIFLVLFLVSAQSVRAETGLLKQITGEDVVRVKDTVYVTGIFENTGQEQVRTRLRAEVRFENRLIGVLKSEEMFVPAGATASLVTEFTPESMGTYDIEGVVLYGKKSTRTRKMVVNVIPRGEGIGFESDNMLVPLAVDSLIAVILVIFVFLFRRKK